MRKFLAMASCFSLIGCSDDPTEPVDAVFRVTIEPLEDTCGGNAPPEGVTAFVDVLLRSDGKVDISKEVYWIPGPDRYEDVSIDGNEVDFPVSRTSPYSGLTLESRIRGSVTPEALDLTVSSESERAGDGAYRKCVRKVRLRGKPRPFGDAFDLDGKYVVAVTWYGQVCPSDPNWPWPAPQWTWNMVLDADYEWPKEPRLVLDGWLAFRPEWTDGQIDWTGDAYASSPGSFLELDAFVSGGFLPRHVDLWMEYREKGDASGCWFRLSMEGDKRIPSLQTRDNDYRAVYTVRDECNGTTETFEDVVELISQDGGQAELKDVFNRSAVQLDYGEITASFGSEAQGLTLTYAGRADPPHLSYTAEYRLLGSDGWCTIGYDVDGVVRYFPDVP